jgi:hypothetical protein
MKRSQIPTTRFIWNLVIVSTLLISQACSSISEKFTGKEQEEITPFAQKAVEVLVVENIQIRDNELIHLRRYVDDSFVELDELQQHMEQVKQYRDKLIAYSIDLVRLTEVYEDDEEMVAAYADRIEQTVDTDELNRLGISEQEWAVILADIRSQESLLGALRTFQPVINTAALDCEALISRIEADLVEAVRKEFDRRIEENFLEVNEFLLRQFDIRNELLAAMIAIDKYRRGDKQAIAEFKQMKTLVSKLFSSSTPDEKQLVSIEAELQERIKNSTMLITELNSDYANYEQARTELDRKEAEIFDALTVARLQIATWTLAHQALANGVKTPGEWMELSVGAARLAGSVAGSILYRP